mmetsp:Transcript_98312/g.261193  ORF Transcript_98312/g.261193 Transcript_98312/m.261193 type:complete len:207 (-) Transcript_98312:889-1509(-)
MPGPPPLSAPAAESGLLPASRSSRPSQKKPASVKRPSPRTWLATPADLATRSAWLLGSALTTAASTAADAGKEVACTSACTDVTSSGPASTTTRMRETVHGSCSEERTSGKGSETPSSGSMSQAPSAPSISTRCAPWARATSSPTTTGSSLWSRRRCMTRSTLSWATTRTMPRPQLKVEDSSLERIFPTAASQRKATGNSQASPRR